ncbi:hypothetical protein [Streptomyces calvus]|uniref:hypothetical protein n=1 Tax=Streptomyces calvus TaxID=67282 RepID=UPI00371A3FC4
MDEDETVPWAAGDLADTIATHDPRGLFTTTALAKHRRRALSTAGSNAMLAQAKSAPGMSLNPDRLDADPYALCTPCEVVDLRTGLFSAPDPSKDFHSRSTTVGGPQAIPTPRWLRFLTDPFGDDAEGQQMIDYLHLLLGYSITDDVGAQILPFLCGRAKR